MGINSRPSLESTSTNSAYNKYTFKLEYHELPDAKSSSCIASILQQSYVNTSTNTNTSTSWCWNCWWGLTRINLGSYWTTLKCDSTTTNKRPFPSCRQVQHKIPAIYCNKQGNIDEVIAQHPNYVNKPNAGTLCQIFARESVFGKNVLARCTVSENGGKTALPFHELTQLKIKIFSFFPKYANSPAQFESLWKTCTKAI